MITTNAIANITSRFIDELIDRGYQYRDSAIEKIMDEWYTQKKPLIELFSKHPKWNPEMLMIHFDEDFDREIDKWTARQFIDYDFKEAVFACRRNGKMSYEEEDIIIEMIDRDIFIGNVYLEKDYLINEKLKFYEGAKVTRVVGKISRYFELDKAITNYNQQYATYCDAISPLKIKRHTCISLNPIDYLLMSNGNSWQSCHDIRIEDGEAGCYSSGTISYMLDGTSFVFYTIDPVYNESEFYLPSIRKIQRQMFAYKDKQLYQSRLYPQSNDYGSDAIYKCIREIIQKVISDCVGMPNLWVKKPNCNLVEQGNGATLYPDWCYFNNCNVTINKTKANEEESVMTVGAEPICIYCGNRHTYSENIDCCNRYSYTTCEHCGCEIYDEDDVIWIDGDPYCGDCVTWCDDCNEYHLNSEMTYVSSCDRYICEECLDDNYSYCPKCGEVYHNDDMVYDEENNEWYCDDCYDELMAEREEEEENEEKAV